jgi:nucleoside 2-deoxyribosyltransferase
VIYLIGSLRHPRVRKVAAELRAWRLEVFDDWHAAGPEADDIWQRYEQERGHTFLESLRGKHAREVFEFDRRNLDQASAGLLVMPAGKSGHLELGYLIGQGKPGYILLEQEPERWDVMYAFATGVHYDLGMIIDQLRRVA